MITFDLASFRSWLAAQPPETLVGSIACDDNPLTLWQTAIGGPLDSVSGCDYGIWGGTWIHDFWFQGTEGVDSLPWKTMWVAEFFIELVLTCVARPDYVPWSSGGDFAAAEVLALLDEYEGDQVMITFPPLSSEVCQ